MANQNPPNDRSTNVLVPHYLTSGPAVENDYGPKEWYLNCQPHHREDGPAVEYVDGSKQWWLT